MSNTTNKASVRRQAAIPKERCPMAQAAEIIGDKWTLLILRESFYGVQRFEDVRTDLGIPRAMLSNRLNKLTDNGILERKPYQEASSRIRHAYVLTAKGRELALLMMALSQWGEKYILQGPAPIHLIDKYSNKPLKVALVPQDAHSTNLTDTKLTLIKDQSQS